MQNRSSFIDWRWGDVIFRGEKVDSYTHHGLIGAIFADNIVAALAEHKVCKIVDFGCGRSGLVHTVSLQLKERVDCAVLPIGLDFHNESVRATKHMFADVLPVMGSMLQLPLPSASIHAGMLRFSLTFIRKKMQSLALKEIYASLRSGARLVVFNDGIFDESPKVVDAYNRLFAKGASYQGCWSFDEIMENRYFPSCANLIALAKEAGFRLIKASNFCDPKSDVCCGYISPKIYSDAFNLTNVQERMLTKDFSAIKEEGILPFEPHSLRVIRPMYACVFEK